MSRRTRAREVAMQVLYQDDLNPSEHALDPDEFLQGRLTADDLIQFSRSLIDGVRRNRAELDELLSSTADNWTLRRMAAIDRNIMRLGAFEIIYTSTPNRVAINEAVELAKRFGTRQSAQFVNGVLDRVLSEHDAAENDQ
ncbi:MAG: transcription antitermination factor NusB [Pirellulales bacterium]